LKINDSNDKDDDYSKSTPNPWKILAILSIISTMVLYAETMLIPAIPHLIRDFEITYSTSSWILSSYLIAGAISVPIAGKLSDLYGRKKVLLIIMVIYTIGVFGGSISTDIYSMIISRTIQGIGMSVFPIVFAIVQDQFPRGKISIAQGTLASMFAFGGVIGLLAGGYIIEYFGWKVTFYSVIPISISLIIIIKKFIRIKEQSTSLNNNTLISDAIQKNQKDTRHSSLASKLDIKGIIFLAISIISFLSSLTLIRSSETVNSKTEFLSPLFVLLCTICIASLSIFIIVEKRSSLPLVDLKLIAKNPLWITNIVVIIWGICTFSIFQTIPVLIQNPGPFGIGGTAIDAANIQLPFSISSLIFGPTGGWIISKIGSTKVIKIGAIILTIGLFGLFMFHNNALILAENLTIVGVGLALLNVGQLNIITSSVPIHYIGVSLGINTLLRYIGSAIGPAIAGMIMQYNLRLTQASDIGIKALPSKESYGLIFLFILILAIVTIILSMLIKKPQKDIVKQAR
jgi:MFS family permease